MKTQINPIETWGFETNFLASPGTVLAKRSPLLEKYKLCAKDALSFLAWRRFCFAGYS